jgi:hypothetical protein
MNDENEGRKLIIPRGLPGEPPISLDMSVIDEAERRMHEVRLVSQATCKELGGLFNQAANLAGRYKAYVKHELLKAEKHHALDRSVVILEVAPAYARANGLKSNEDIREALICKDAACSASLDIVNALKAVEALFDSSQWSYIRACAAADENANSRNASPTPYTGGHIGQLSDSPQPNFMGKKNGGFNG